MSPCPAPVTFDVASIIHQSLPPELAVSFKHVAMASAKLASVMGVGGGGSATHMQPASSAAGSAAAAGVVRYDDASAAPALHAVV